MIQQQKVSICVGNLKIKLPILKKPFKPSELIIIFNKFQ